MKIERVKGKLEYVWFYSISHQPSFLHQYIHYSSYLFHKWNIFPESNSAIQFFECIFMLLISYYYVKKKAKLILFSTILHTFNTDTQFVWKVLFWGYFPLACIEDQSSNLPWEQHCHCVGLFTTDTDSYFTGKIKSLFHITKMQCTIFIISFFSLSASISLKALKTKIKQPSINQLNKHNNH